MTLGGVNPGDIVLADRKGRRFYALVVERRERELEVEPIDRRITYRTVKAREVLGIWRKSRARSGGIGRAASHRASNDRAEPVERCGLDLEDPSEPPQGAHRKWIRRSFAEASSSESGVMSSGHGP